MESSLVSDLLVVVTESRAQPSISLLPRDIVLTCDLEVRLIVCPIYSVAILLTPAKLNLSSPSELMIRPGPRGGGRFAGRPGRARLNTNFVMLGPNQTGLTIRARLSANPQPRPRDLICFAHSVNL